MKKILITDDVHEHLISSLKQLGYEVDFFPETTLAEVYNIVHRYHGLIINSKIIVDNFFLEKAPLLQFVARLGSGMEIIDKEAAVKRNIAVLNSPEGNRNAVAEHALGMLLCLARNLNRTKIQLQDLIWKREENRGWELKGKSIGIIGFGHTGSSFAKKLRGMEMDVLVYDKYKTDIDACLYGIKVEPNLENLFGCDIISLHLPLTSETMYFVNQDFIQRCKKGVIIINTSRGKVVHTKDLIRHLDSGYVAGACLDVFENEHPHTYSIEETAMYNNLNNRPNVIISPHIAGWTKESKYNLSAILFKKIEALENKNL